jgi:hypothetical protein
MKPTNRPTFNVASYAAAHDLDARRLRKNLRAAGLKAPYRIADVARTLAALRAEGWTPAGPETEAKLEKGK